MLCGGTTGAHTFTANRPMLNSVVADSAPVCSTPIGKSFGAGAGVRHGRHHRTRLLPIGSRRRHSEKRAKSNDSYLAHVRILPFWARLCLRTQLDIPRPRRLPATACHHLIGVRPAARTSALPLSRHARSAYQRRRGRPRRARSLPYPSQTLLGIGSEANASSPSGRSGSMPAMRSSIIHCRTCWPTCHVVRSRYSCRSCGP